MAVHMFMCSVLDPPRRLNIQLLIQLLFKFSRALAVTSCMVVSENSRSLANYDMDTFILLWIQANEPTYTAGNHAEAHRLLTRQRTHALHAHTRKNRHTTRGVTHQEGLRNVEQCCHHKRGYAMLSNVVTTRGVTHLHRMRSSGNHFHEIWSVCKHAAEVLFEAVLPVGSRTRIHFEAYSKGCRRVFKLPEVQQGKRWSACAMPKRAAITCSRAAHAARVLCIGLHRDERAALKRRDTAQFKWKSRRYLHTRVRNTPVSIHMEIFAFVRTECGETCIQQQLRYARHAWRSSFQIVQKVQTWPSRAILIHVHTELCISDATPTFQIRH